MATIRSFISASLGLILLIQCNTKQHNSHAEYVLPSSAKTQNKKQLTGEWKYANSIWYSSELTLEENGFFKFHDQSCYGQKFSQGHWIYNNGIVVLTSFDIFRQSEKSVVTKPIELADQKKAKFKKGEVRYSFAGFQETTPFTMSGPNDTVRIYLNKLQLELRNDTLYRLGSDALPEKAKFHRAD